MEVPPWQSVCDNLFSQYLIKVFFILKLSYLCNMFGQVINAGNFWAHPIGSPGSEFQNFMGNLNDHFRKSTTSQAVPRLEKGQVSTTKTTTTTFACTHSCIICRYWYSTATLE